MSVKAISQSYMRPEDAMAYLAEKLDSGEVNGVVVATVTDEDVEYQYCGDVVDRDITYLAALMTADAVAPDDEE